jgi:L-lactate dehydrogenase
MEAAVDSGSAARFDYKALRGFAAEVLAQTGLPKDRALTIAEVLIEADLMGHTTHGLAQIGGVVKGLESGAVKKTGEPEVVSDKGSAVVWDAGSLPGTWLMSKAVEQACDRARELHVVTYVIRKAANIACLGAYLRKATDRGMLAWIMNSDPAMRTVAPAGGIAPQIAPNPFAFGYPTESEPILIDTSTSPIANGWIRRWASDGTMLPEPWLQDADGKLSTDPKVLFGTPGASMLPLGGLVLGHKGFALGLIVEVLTAALSGTGRSNPDQAKGGTPVFLQVIDPEAFAGLGFLKQEASWLAEACRSGKPRAADKPVRMPGDSANTLRARQLKDGVALHVSIVPVLKDLAKQKGLQMPSAL